MSDEKSSAAIKKLRALTPARIGVGRAGTRPRTSTLIDFWADHAEAKDAVKSDLSPQFIDAFCQEYQALSVHSTAENRDDFVLFPPRGKKLRTEDQELVRTGIEQDRDVAVIISDGLSARAVEENVPDLYPMLLDGFASAGVSSCRPVIVRFGRVAVGDQIGHLAGAKIALNLIGERPGLSCASGLSAYITYNPNPATTISSDRTVVSNIHAGGTPPVEAGAFIVKVIERILELKVSGVKLQAMS
ncbi:MAG: ethanolamine ammonia-lyase subunit EutC [Cyanobacteria bacterium SZAS LIN-2]|nr:ethanolamine ammonia-lyase subunit EutC [Cyanobacteria bacterium SZAS LIN-2]